MSERKPSAVTGPMRLPFLILTPACVALGTATAFYSGAAIEPVTLVLILVGAICAHISVNALNEYDDFHSGLDLKTNATPFSGGSKSLPGNPEQAHYALITGIVALFIVVLTGLYFIRLRGWWLLPLGILGVIVIVSYTRWITRSPWLCLLAPGLGFGPLMVMGTDFVLTGSYSWAAFIASLVPFFLVNDLLLLNQFPDVEADASIGRYHLPIAEGLNASVQVYGIFLAGSYLSIITGIVAGEFPAYALCGLITVAIAIPTYNGVRRNYRSIPDLIPLMGKNVIINIATPLLLAAGIALGKWL